MKLTAKQAKAIRRLRAALERLEETGLSAYPDNGKVGIFNGSDEYLTIDTDADYSVRVDKMKDRF